MFAIILLAFTFSKHTVSGTVVDENNNPLSSVSISLKTTTSAVSTDANGFYKIEADSDDILIFSSVGFLSQEMKVGNKNIINVKLRAIKAKLDEVVVVGYGVEKKELMTGSAPMTSNTMYIRGNTYAGNELNGKVAGLTIVRNNEEQKSGWRNNDNFNREGYDNIQENPFLKATDNPLSTFSIDVDGASYSNIRRMINSGQMPPAGAVRIEEMINYFSYNYPQPTGDAPFSINTEYVECPWNAKHQLVSIGLQGKKIATESLPAANIVFLIDVSGSMQSADKLPLVKSSMKLLADQLRPQDKVSIVVYAGNAGLVLPATNGNEKIKIKEAISKLEAGGSTAGGAGIQLAYKTAQENFVSKGNNRIVLCTDGDFNVGVSSDDALERLIGEKRASGIFLTVLGYGTGNYQDAKMQKLADKGNGNHAYIDNISEARKVLINQFGGTMFTIAKDVKLQIEFNPAKVQGYRLIGYENRMLAKEDFNDDKKDAGELGSGHTVTALYEIIPVGPAAPELKKVDNLKYQRAENNFVTSQFGNEVMTVKFRYKKPDGDKSLLLQKIITGSPVQLSAAGENFYLASAVAQFGMLLRNSEYKGSGGYKLAESLLSKVIKNDEQGYRNELKQLMKSAIAISNQQAEIYSE